MFEAKNDLLKVGV